jgi:hypothetical protein
MNYTNKKRSRRGWRKSRKGGFSFSFRKTPYQMAIQRIRDELSRQKGMDGPKQSYLVKTIKQYVHMQYELLKRKSMVTPTILLNNFEDRIKDGFIEISGIDKNDTENFKKFDVCFHAYMKKMLDYCVSKQRTSLPSKKPSSKSSSYVDGFVLPSHLYTFC